MFFQHAYLIKAWKAKVNINLFWTCHFFKISHLNKREPSLTDSTLQSINSLCSALLCYWKQKMKRESSQTWSLSSQQGNSNFKERSSCRYTAVILCWATRHMMLQVNWHIPPCNHWWHLNVRLSTWIRCVPCSSQLRQVLSLCPRVFKNITDCPLAEAVEGGWHLKYSVSTNDPSP